MSYVISAHCVGDCVLHRAERDKELEKRIRQHTEAMHERRRKAKQGTPQQEMEAAMRELEVVSTVHAFDRSPSPPPPRLIMCRC